MKKSRQHTLHYLWHSLEMHTVRRDFLIYLGLFGFLCLLALPGGSNTGAETLMLICLLPVLIFYIWRVICIFRDPEGYYFCECQLTQPHSNFWLKMMYFTVYIELPNGRTDTVDTHAIFEAHGIMEPRMEDYVNSKATIAYNPSTGMVVVIQ